MERGKKKFDFFRKKSRKLKRWDVFPFLILVYPLLAASWVWETVEVTLPQLVIPLPDQCTWNPDHVFWDVSPRCDRNGTTVYYAKDLWEKPYVVPESLFHKLLETYEHPPFFAALGFLFAIFLNALLYLFTHWSVGVLAFVAFDKTNGIEDSTHVKVTPSKVGAKAELCEIQRSARSAAPRREAAAAVQPWITYQQKRMAYDTTAHMFFSPDFPVKSPISTYLTAKGLSSQEASSARRKFGSNSHDVAKPTFMELYKENALSPLFVFQVFCLVFWMLDEYWQYSVATLCMLIFVEAEQVKRRLAEIENIHKMRPKPHALQVFRDGEWKWNSSDNLVPGDIIALSNSAGKGVPCACDALLLRGSLTMNEALLTGESLAQFKVPLQQEINSASSELLDVERLHKQSVISSGTEIIMSDANQDSGEVDHIPKVRDQSGETCCVAYVLRTGFSTTQGKLVRTIFYSTERMTASSREAYGFLLLLLVAACFAAGYVLHQGLADPDRSRFKILLNCGLIITSVVPFEFPLTMSIAVSLSLVEMARREIFCIEPFRVTYAGKATLCAFDKTGTLTSDKAVIDSVAGLQPPWGVSPPLPEGSGDVPTAPKQPGGSSARKSGKATTPPKDATLAAPLPFITAGVMAGCSALGIVKGDVVGDPLEVAACAAAGWHVLNSNVVASKKSRDRLNIIRRFPFASELQRMTTVCTHEGPGEHLLPEGFKGQVSELPLWMSKPKPQAILVFMKGSPEMVQKFLKEVPENYQSQNRELAVKGMRVVALAAKWETDLTPQDVRHLPREKFETRLHFVGFVTLTCPVKPGTSRAMTALANGQHRLICLTGDNPLTASQVALEVGIIREPPSEGILVLRVRSDASHPQHDSPSPQPSAGADSSSSSSSSESSSSGDAISKLIWESRDGKRLLNFSDQDSALRELSARSALCVTGHSLQFLSLAQIRTISKYADIYARTSPEQKQLVVQAFAEEGHVTVMCGDGTNDVGALKAAHAGISLLNLEETTHVPIGGIRAVADDQPKMVELGDACIASPFISKGKTVKCVPTLIRLGRATLVTMLMMYKFMAINSLISAFTYSVLSSGGIKFGDFQAAAENIFISLLSFVASKAKPASDMAPIRPPQGLFTPSFLLSIFGQASWHLAILLAGRRLAMQHLPRNFDFDVDGPFSPNLVNTVVYLLYGMMHVSTFVANYPGEPFVVPLRTALTLLRGSTVFVGILVLCALEVFPSFNLAMSLVPMPTTRFRVKVAALLLLDGSVAVLIARFCNFLAIRSARKQQR